MDKKDREDVKSYFERFVSQVLSLASGEDREDILNGKMSVGAFLCKHAHKGISACLVTECLSLHDYGRLENIAFRQNRIDAYYQDYKELFISKGGPSLHQDVVNEGIENYHIKYVDDNGEIYFITSDLLLRRCENIKFDPKYGFLVRKRRRNKLPK